MQRQWVRPPITASRDSRAPCRKNTRPMAILVAQSKTGAAAPLAGRIEAATTMPRISRR